MTILEENACRSIVATSGHLTRIAESLDSIAESLKSLVAIAQPASEARDTVNARKEAE